MLILIFAFTSLVLIGSTYGSYRQYASVQNDRLMNLHLVTGMEQAPKAIEILAKYRQTLKRYSLLSLLLNAAVLPLSLFSTSIFLICYFIWCFGYFFLVQKLFKNSSFDLYRFKEQLYPDLIHADENPCLQKASRMSKAGILLLTLLFGFLSVMFLVMDFYPYHMEITDTQVRIQAPPYSTVYPRSELKEVLLLDTLPDVSKSRTNGAGTAQYLLGHFSMKGYGSCMLYYYLDYSPVLQLTFEDCTVFFNSKTPGETKELYNLLKSAENRLSFSALIDSSYLFLKNNGLIGTQSQLGPGFRVPIIA